MPRILMVEDDSMICDIMFRRLKFEGYDVITANDGAQAVQRARMERPNLIVMDMGLPVLSGWQAVYQIRSMLAAHHIPIIALTAYAMIDDRAECLRVGCDDYEIKPVDFGRLIGKIQALLNKNHFNTGTL